MQTALEHYKEINTLDLALLHNIREWLHALPDKGHPCDSGAHLWGCHSLCRAAKDRFKLVNWSVIDGWFGRPAFDHTWLTRAVYRGDHYQGEVILDVYPVASAGGPLLLFSGTWNTPWTEMYGKSVPGRYESRLAEFKRDADAILACRGRDEFNQMSTGFADNPVIDGLGT